VHPTPEELDLMGLGAMVSIMRRMTAEERLLALDWIGARYGERVPDYSCDRCRLGVLCLDHGYAEGEVRQLGEEIAEARLRGIQFGSYAMARIVLDAGYRRVAGQ
jgi:hypothetical protein